MRFRPDFTTKELFSGGMKEIPTKEGRLPLPKEGNLGFTLVELIVVAAILGVLILMVIPAYNKFVTSTRNARCIAEIHTLETDINSYLVEHADIPNTLADINRDSLLDPFGNPYQYLHIGNNPGTEREDVFTNPLNSDYDLYSLGADGASAQSLDDPSSKDDIVRASEGGFTGIVTKFLSP